MKVALCILFLAILVSSCLSSQGKCCIVREKVYADGASVPSGDSCNTCGCNNGSVWCTEISCLLPCTWQGQELEYGQKVPSLDGCNTCTCGDNREVYCTEKACPPATPTSPPTTESL